MTDLAVQDKVDEQAAESTAHSGDVVTHPIEGPCTAEEAEQLIAEAAAAADTFYEKMNELIRREAWIPLGFHDMRELVLKRLATVAINPKTGKAYSRAHTYRLARTAWFLYAIAKETGLDSGQITLTERSLRDLPAGAAGDQSLVDSISRDVAAVSTDGNASPDDVNAIVEQTLAAAAGRPTDAAESADQDAVSAEDDENDSADGGEGINGGTLDADSDGRSPGGQGRDSAPAAGSDTEPSGEDSAASDGPSEPQSPAFDAYSSPGDDEDDEDDFQAAAPATDFGDAMARMRESSNYTATVDELVTISEKLPTVSKLADELPGFLDILDDEELTEFAAKLKKCQSLLDRIDETKKAIDDIVDEAEAMADY